MSLLTVNDGTAGAPLVATERLLWVGPLTVLTSLAAVHAVRVLALTTVRVSDGSALRGSLGWIAPTADTIILCSLAVVVFAIIGSFSDDPLRTYQRVALGALFASLLPIVIMAPRGMQGDVRIALTLAAMHVAAYVPCVTLMPRLTALRTQETHP
jgi:hypothetical protein